MQPHKTEWHPRAICPECNWSIYAPFGSLFHTTVHNCPKCGFEKYDYQDTLSPINRSVGAKEWPVRTMRWVSTARGWRFWTWGTGRWEQRKPGI